MKEYIAALEQELSSIENGFKTEERELYRIFSPMTLLIAGLWHLQLINLLFIK